MITVRYLWKDGIHLQDLATTILSKNFIEFVNTVKPLNSGHLRFLKNLSVIKRCPLLGGSLTEIVTFGTKHFVCCPRHVRYLGYPLLRGFTVIIYLVILTTASD